tara:strand:- start:55 stop:270 length:216 start_codon:yes stop_codon:yes gene_type:complete
MNKKKRIEELESAVCALEINETRLMQLVERLQEDLAKVVERYDTLEEGMVISNENTNNQIQRLTRVRQMFS